jgi:transketolase
VLDIHLIPQSEFARLNQAALSPQQRLPLLADMCRANALAAVKRAGSGHLGSSFSAMDIVVCLYYQEMNTIALGYDDPNRDIYFSSKGHDVPGLYAVLYSLGVLPAEKLLMLRRFGGLDGHPDVGVRGIEANSGSLGMGISKGRGMAWAKRMAGYGGRVFVMLGDGELQEGQNYEALQSTVHQGIGNLTVIVDHNKVQSDKQVVEIVDLGDIERKFSDFGWQVRRCNGHDFSQIAAALAEFRQISDRPTALIADTIKGRGVSFMEHPQALKDAGGYYRWHAGAPDDASFAAGHAEIIARIDARLHSLGLAPVALQTIASESAAAPVARNALGEPISKGAEAGQSLKAAAEYVVEAYGKALVKLAGERPDLVVLDADLAADCRVREFELTYPDRFIQNGIAEQDMVSMAGGLARMGLLPVVNSFASFLASRANEQIYNNASEKTKIIYALHYAGLIPAGPGKSHQSLRDISLLAALPNMTILQPCNPAETAMAVEYCVNQASENCAIRLAIGPSPRHIDLPPGYRLTPGRGVALTYGQDALLFAYGPVMLHEALSAAELLAGQGFGLKVIDMPWLNRVDPDWLHEILAPYPRLFVLEDHAPVGGLADSLLGALAAGGDSSRPLVKRPLVKLAVEGYPACGTPAEALSHHRLDGASLAARIPNPTNT